MKKGFTLIELLAVIVILAIIALIAVPIVLNIIDDAKESSLLRSAEFYLDAVEYTIADAFLYHGGLSDGDYPLTEDGDICKEDESPCTDANTLKVEVNGDKPTGGSITIANGNIEDVEIILSEKTIVKNSLDELVYQESLLCTANTTKATALVHSSGNPANINSYTPDVPVGKLASDGEPFAKGVAYTCNFIDDNETNNMTFFVLSEAEDTVTLISGANLGGTVAWSEDENNHKDESEDAQALTAKAALASGISTWEKIKDMDDVIVKIPTAYDIAEAAGQTFSGSRISGLPTWLTSYSKEPISWGYWTSTPSAEDSISAWYVYTPGSIDYYNVAGYTNYGVRPVITISKSNI